MQSNFLCLCVGAAAGSALPVDAAARPTAVPAALVLPGARQQPAARWPRRYCRQPLPRHAHRRQCPETRGQSSSTDLL